MRFFSLAALAVATLFASGLQAGSGYVYESSYPWMQSEVVGADSSVGPNALPEAPANSAGAGGGFRLTVDAGPVTNDVSGFIQIDELNGGIVSVGSQADFNDNLNLESDDGTRFGAKLNMGFFSIEAAMQDLSYTSDSVTGVLTIFGSAIDFTQPASSDLDLPYMQLKLGFELNSPDPADDDWLGFGIGIGVHYFDFSFKFNAREDITNTIVDEETTFPAPLPTLGFMLSIMPSESLSFEAAIWAMVVPEVEGVEGSIYDANIVAKYYLLDNVAIGVRFGMVMIDVEANVEDDDDTIIGDLQIETTQLSAVIGFSF